MPAKEAPISLESAGDLLKKAGLRKTVARVHLLQCLASQTGPRTQAEINADLEPHGFDSSTIFRGLTDLTSSGLVVRLDTGDRIWRFELHDRTSDGDRTERHHPHVVCVECGTLWCLPTDTIERFSDKIPGWQISDLLLRGTCKACAQKT
ncbi:MAG: transcriptional repressor [Planctomycetaceae bacterium]|nr:transcriptional repressor [Planctomycetaceae bacterium]